MEKTETPKDAPLTQRLKDTSLKAAGSAYLIGDTAIVVSGIVEGNPARTKTGLAWGVAGIFPAFFGNPSQEKKLELVSRKLGDYLRKQNVKIPNDPTVDKLTKEGGVVDHVTDFLYAHPSEIMNAIYAIGASQLVISGLPGHAKSGKATAAMDITAGILVGAGALAGLLIKERKPDPDKPPHTAMEKVQTWAQEKPLRVSGAFYHVNNIAMMAGAYFKRKNEKIQNTKESYYWRALTAGSYVFGNTMLMLSSKHNTAEKNSDIAVKVADLSAKIIAAQPKEVQEALVQNIAGYLAAQPEIKKTAPEIAFMLHEKLSQTRTQLAAQPSWQRRVQAVMSQPDSPQLG